MYDEVDLSDATLLVTDRFGIYVPQYFAQSFEFEQLNLSDRFKEDYECILKGPVDYNDWYWEAWSNIFANATLKDTDGNEHYLYQDGDLWAVPVSKEV